MTKKKLPEVVIATVVRPQGNLELFEIAEGEGLRQYGIRIDRPGIAAVSLMLDPEGVNLLFQTWRERIAAE